MIEAGAIERSEGGGGGWLINHLPTILWHRRLYVIIPAVLLFVAGLATAYSLPTLYRSTATMLVESQDLPTDIVQAPGTGEIEKRIAKIREQVLSRGDLISLIEQNNLYEAERRSKPMSYVVDKMRKATTVGALAGDIGGSSPANGNVIAINMAFDYPEPAKAQAVMQSYVTQFLRMDNDQIEDQANLTVRFLSEQAAKLQAQVQGYRKSDHSAEGEQWRRLGRRRRYDVHGHRLLHRPDHRAREPEPAAYGAGPRRCQPILQWRQPKLLWPSRNRHIATLIPTSSRPASALPS